MSSSFSPPCRLRTCTAWLIVRTAVRSRDPALLPVMQRQWIMSASSFLVPEAERCHGPCGHRRARPRLGSARLCRPQGLRAMVERCARCTFGRERGKFAGVALGAPCAAALASSRRDKNRQAALSKPANPLHLDAGYRSEAGSPCFMTFVLARVFAEGASCVKIRKAVWNGDRRPSRRPDHDRG